MCAAGRGPSLPNIGDIARNGAVNVLGYNTAGTWAKIQYRGQIGWVSAKYLSTGIRSDGSALATGPHVVTGIKANDPDRGLVVRTGAGSGFTALGVLLQRFSPGGGVDSFVYSQPRGGGNKDHQPSHLPMGNGGLRCAPVSTTAASSGGGQGDPTGQARETGALNQHNPQFGLPEGQANSDGLQAGWLAHQPQQDPFDLTGDLDWRFDDGFLWGLDDIDFQTSFP